MQNYAQQLYHKIVKYRLDDHYPEIAALKVRLEHNRLSQFVVRAWLRKIEPYVEQQKRCWNPFPAAAGAEELGKFDIELGHLKQARDTPVGVRFIARPNHIITCGGTGSGKSTLNRRIIRQTEQDYPDIRILVLDLKGDYLHLPDELGRDRWRLYSWTEGFRMGIGPPSGPLSPSTWINQIAKILAAQCNLAFSQSTLSAAMRFLTAQLNQTPHSPLIFPDLALIYEVLDYLPPEVFSKKESYTQSALHQLEFLSGNSGELFRAFTGFDVQGHLIDEKHNAVIDLVNLSPILTAIVVEIIASQLLLTALARHDTSDRTNLLLVIDESDYLCSARIASAYPEEYSVLGQLLKQGREFGIMVCLGMTFLGKCSPYITADSTYHFLFNPVDAQSTYQSVRILQEPQAGKLLNSLVPGECVFHEIMGPCSWPMLARIDYDPPYRGGRPDQFDQHDYLPSRSLADLPDLKKAVDKLLVEYLQTRTRQKKQVKPVSNEARKLMGLIANHSWAPCSRLWPKIGKLNFVAQKSIRAKLEREKLVIFNELRIGRTMQLLPLLTEDGYDYLGLTVPDSRGRGGQVHDFIAHWVDMTGQQRGYKTRIEALVPGTSHPVDVAWWINGQMHVFEVISTCSKNIHSHLRNCLIQSQEVSSVTIVAAQKKELQLIEQNIVQESDFTFVLDHIKYQPASDFLEELWP